MILQSHTWAYIRKRQKLYFKKICPTTMFMAALFIIAKQNECPLTDK